MAQKKDKRVEVVNKYNTIARPLETDLPKWLAQGWKLKEEKADAKSPGATVNKEQN